MIRITLVGPESTGKSTLSRDLAKHFHTLWVPEFSRIYAGNKNGPLTVEDVAPIAAGQIASEDALIPLATRVIFLDTDLVMTAMYAELYYGACPPAVREAARARLADLYLLLEPDVPWVADPARDMPHRRPEIRDRIAALLKGWGARVVSIEGTWPERFQQAQFAVGSLR